MRKVTLFTGQFADLPLEQLADKAKGWGYDGLELACWGDHLDVARAATDKKYARGRLELLAKHGLEVFAISNHLAGQLICDLNNDARSDAFAPAEYAGNAEAKRAWAIESMKNAARRPIWYQGDQWLHRIVHLALLYLPSGIAAMIDAGFVDFANVGIRFSCV